MLTSCCFSSAAALTPMRGSALDGPPTASIVPPGQCVFGEDFAPATLVAKQRVGTSSHLFTFALADPTKPLGLSTCACILARGGADAEGKAVVRPYTPVSTNALVGHMELLVKVYPGGQLSGHLDALPLGGTMDFKHVAPNVKIQYPFNKKRIGMICGGTGGS
jgi:cytochrome-b5 reductase